MLRKRNESESERAWHHEVGNRLQSFPITSTLTVVAIGRLKLGCLQADFGEP